MPRRGRRRGRGAKTATPVRNATSAAAALVVNQSLSQPQEQPLRNESQPQKQQNGAIASQSTQAVQATTPGWKRVGPRELGSITRPSFFDDSSSSSSDDHQHLHRRYPPPLTNGKRRPFNSTPTKEQKVRATPRKERARRQELLRLQSGTGPDHPLRDNVNDMASQQGKWREEQVLIVCPGSQTTMAQLGCSELTPPAQRIPTRMFKDEESDEYRPFHTYKRKKASTPEAANGDKGEDGFEFVEDRDSVEGAIYPVQGGRIVNMEAFLAFLDHVHSLLTTTYHNTPIVLMASPQWTRPDCEAIARYVFEKTKTPALCLLNSAVAAQYGLKWPTMTVVDIGFEKVDVTCIYDNNIVSHKDLGYPNPAREISGGEVFTQKLLSLLKDKNFTYDMAEQLKKSPLCEVLPYVGELPELMELPTEGSASSTGQAAAPVPSAEEGPTTAGPTKPAVEIGPDNENENPAEKEGDEGVLDVANIVTSGNAREFLAKKEKEKAEKAKAKKQSKAQEAEAAAKPARLPNSKRKLNVFHYEDIVHEDVDVPLSNGAPKVEPAKSTNEDAPTTDVPATDGAPASEEAKPEPKPEGNGETPGDNLPPAPESTKTMTLRRTKRVRRDIEVGLERFFFADRGEIDRITETIYRTIQSVDDVYKRSSCWESLVFVGNGSRLRGLKDNIMQTLSARHLISPSTATMFTSELPSNVATPTGTGSQTPTGSFTGPLPSTSSVNPLLQAATTASLNVPGSAQASGSTSGENGVSHHAHGQTPMVIKQAVLPTYLAEWTKNGFEEAMFLGSLVAARLAYCIHNLDASGTEAQRTMSLNRVDYNEMGPKAIRTHSMLGNS